MNHPNLHRVLDLCFKRVTLKDEGTVIYYQECVLLPGEHHGTQGYLWVYEDGETLHSYRTPEQCFECF